ncbi:putative ESAT-6-like protein 6 [Mycobacterium marinum]|nr:putative ESAT-6-like protein 6 [Mycobacterium marinum]
MTINYQFGDVDAHGALIRAQAASLEAEHQAIVRDVLAAGDFWGGAGSVACQEFITQLGRNFQVIYEQANSHGWRRFGGLPGVHHPVGSQLPGDLRAGQLARPEGSGCRQQHGADRQRRQL